MKKHDLKDDTNVSDTEDELNMKCSSFKSNIRDFPNNRHLVKSRELFANIMDLRKNSSIEPKNIVDD